LLILGELGRGKKSSRKGAELAKEGATFLIALYNYVTKMRAVAPLVIFFAGFRCLAQSPAPAFEVASVRLAATEGNVGVPIRTSPDSLNVHGVSLRDCIQMAYRMPATRVTGPNWLSDVRLDIVAKTGGPVEEQQLYLMLRTLLGERLGVKVHIEQKEMPAYALILAKGGPKFSESTTEGPPAGRSKAGVMSFERFSMSDFATALSPGFGRPVVDATGLKGHYDVRMDSTSYWAAATADGNKSSPADIIGMLITALQEQLGLKVESRKELIDTLVVDHAEKTPTGN
jgi:uncharacterized protein (TIGR03435 family)